MTYSPFAPNMMRRQTQGNVTELHPDVEAQHLLNRIKTSKAPRQDRDSLCGMVRWQAVYGRMEQSAVCRLLKMLIMFEKTAEQRPGQMQYDVPPELTVDQELECIRKEREQREAQEAMLDRACVIARTFQFVKPRTAPEKSQDSAS